MPCTLETSMGLRYGLGEDSFLPKRKFRWLFSIERICADDNPVTGINCLPPKRSARPSLSWKEFEFQHVSETIYYPMKPEWKPINLIMYDTRCNVNPVFDWIRLSQDLQGPGLYDPEQGIFGFVVDSGIKRQGTLNMLDGCGAIIEQWTFENCYPQTVDFEELDMEDSGIVMVNVTLRYDRSFISQS